ncbi:MAG: phosphonate ABC transporter, permease protein PhnE [Thermodesulfobacteriota bacterium]|nr:phosphonate ABC transporter, permease protein PhnE [Thermodesulfobacteriota bacterium]
MQKEATLEDLAPRLTPRRKIALTVMGITISAILIFSYVWCDISPFKVWNKRQNAFEYLFGRQVDEIDKKTARHSAKRLPQIIAQEEARSQVREKYKALQSDQKPDHRKKNREIEDLVKKILADQDPVERQRMIDEEYIRLLDLKRGGFFPPETRSFKLLSYSTALLETVMMAIWGTLLAVIAAIPFSLFAAKNVLELIAPGESFFHRSLRWISYFVVRRLLDSARGFNEFVMALMFVAIIGLGPFAGILALFIHTTGILGKVFSEAIEAIEPGQVEALVSTGSGSGQVISFSIIPQVMPTIVSYSLLRFESNVRSATILGFCGAGGIGFLMFDKLNGYLYREVCMMMIMVIVSVSILDYLCGKLRNYFI